MVSEVESRSLHEIGFGSMSKKERLALSLDRLTDLCFTISELAIDEGSEGEVAKPSTVLRPEAAVFTPSRKGKEQVSGDQESKSAISESWESVPDLPSASVDTPPTFSQVVGSNSQSVYVTPVRRVVRAQSVDSAESGIDMAAAACRRWCCCCCWCRACSTSSAEFTDVHGCSV